jgi:hypothetical protein
MLKEMVAAFGANHIKAHPLEGFDETITRDSRKITQAVTATRWTPMNSVDAGFSTSRQSSIASLTLFMSTSSDFACVWHPRNEGTEATK